MAGICAVRIIAILCVTVAMPMAGIRAAGIIAIFCMAMARITGMAVTMCLAARFEDRGGDWRTPMIQKDPKKIQKDPKKGVSWNLLVSATVISWPFAALTSVVLGLHKGKKTIENLQIAITWRCCCRKKHAWFLDARIDW